MPSTYAEFVSAIPAFAMDQSAQFVAQVDNFLQMAQFRLSREAQLSAFDFPLTGQNLMAGQSTVTMPNDLTAISNITVYDSMGNRTVLEKKTLEYIYGVFPSTSSSAQVALPTYWGLFAPATAGGQPMRIVIAGTPSVALTYDLIYRRRLALLSGTNTTNWLTDNCPDTLLAAAIVEGGRFKQNAGLMSEWEDRYQRDLGMINAEAERQRRDDYATQPVDTENPIMQSPQDAG